MMRRCIVCGRRLWFSRTGHRTLPGGRIVQWHSSHFLPRYREDIAAYIVEPRP